MFFPDNGEYLVIIGDNNNHIESDNNEFNSEHVGGNNFNYELHIGPVNFSPELLEINNQIEREITPAGTLDAYSLTVSTEYQQISIETFASRLDPVSFLDTNIIILDPSNNILIQHDDIDYDNGILDSLVSIISNGTEPGTYTVIIDYWESEDNVNLKYHLRISSNDLDYEIEPDNDYLTAFPLNTELSVNGTIGQPVTSIDSDGILHTTDDRDWYKIIVKSGDFISFNCIAKNENSIIDPLIKVIKVETTSAEPFISVLNQNNDSNITDLNAYAEVLFSDPGEYYVIVLDNRNYKQTESDKMVGGPDYTYNLKATIKTLDLDPVTIPHTSSYTIAPGGSINFYSINFLAGDKLTIKLTVDEESDLEPIVYLGNLGVNDKYSILDSNSDIDATSGNLNFKNIFAGSSNSIISVMNNALQGQNLNYTLDLTKETLTIISVEGIDDYLNAYNIAAAETEMESNYLFAGEIDSSSENLANFYKINLRPGHILSAATYAGKNTPLQDTVLTLFTLLEDEGNNNSSVPLIKELIVNDDDNKRNNNYSAIHEYIIEKNAAYFLKIEPYSEITVDDAGEYLLEVEQKTCVSSVVSSHGDIIINEYLLTVPSNEEDANGDGITDDNDMFIELYNNTENDMDLSGFSLSGTNGSVKFICFTTIKAGEILVVFNGSNPSGEFGFANVTVINNFADIIDTNDNTLVLKDNDGNLIDTVVINDQIAGQSLTRQPDITGNFIAHTVTTNESSFSPGLMVDGTSFSKTAIEVEPNDIWEQATNLESTFYSILGSINCGLEQPCMDPVDWFKFTVSNDTIVHIWTEAGPNTKKLDTFLQLFDSDINYETPLAFNDDIDYIAENYFSEIKYTITVAGTYYIELKPMVSFGSVSGNYLLNIEFLDVP